LRCDVPPKRNAITNVDLVKEAGPAEGFQCAFGKIHLAFCWGVWLPFICLFAPFGTAFADHQPWYLAYTSTVYLWARLVFLPATTVLASILGGPAIIEAGLCQSALLTIALSLFFRRLSRMFATAT
jgi:hypothetical protein